MYTYHIWICLGEYDVENIDPFLCTHIMFGFAAMSFIEGNTLGVENLPKLFSLPFVTPETNPNYASEEVVPMIPALVILIPPILAAIGLRLVLYVGIHRIIDVVTTYLKDSKDFTSIPLFVMLDQKKVDPPGYCCCCLH